MNVSIVGAGKKRNGIGEYIARYFRKNGANVTAVLGTTEETSSRASLALRKYGIEARSYTDFLEMVDYGKPDTVVIASPSSTHYGYLVKCIHSGLNVFCEKPFVWGDAEDMGGRLRDLFDMARKKRLTVAMNSQWPFSIPYYEALCGKITVGEFNTFSMISSPSCSGNQMIPESIPHALSLLYSVLGPGAVEDLNFESIEERKTVFEFRYVAGLKECFAQIQLATQETQPRDFSYGFNGKVVSRRLNLIDYAISFHYEDKKIRIPDPLELSVRNFMDAVEKKKDPLIGYSHVLNNISCLSRLYEGYEKRKTWKS